MASFNFFSPPFASGPRFFIKQKKQKREREADFFFFFLSENGTERFYKKERASLSIYSLSL